MTAPSDLVLLDTSVIVGGTHPGAHPWTISVATLAELHLGVLGAQDGGVRRQRLRRLATIEASVAPLAFDAEVARTWAELADVVRLQGRSHRARSLDLVIAATARVHGIPLYTTDRSDFAGLEGHVDIRRIAAGDRSP